MTKKLLWRLLPLLLAAALFTSCDSLDFNMESYDLHVTVDPVAAGTVSPSMDSTYYEGIQVNLQATPAEGYAFVGWEGDLDTLNATANPLSFVIYDDYNLVAKFAKKRYELSIRTAGKGEVMERIVSAKTYEHGTVVELKAVPAPGYEFVRWEGDISSAGNPVTVTMDGPSTVNAVFRVKSTSAVVDVNVDWQALNSAGTQAKLGNYYGAALSDSITHFGLRMVYPGSGIDSLKQSVEKVTAGQNNRLSIEVKNSGPARLFATAVRHEAGKDKVFLFGTIEDLDIQLGTQYEWSVSDISWRKASWRVVDSLAVEYEQGTFVRDRNDRDLQLWLLLNTPYRTEANVAFEDLIVRVQGFGAGEGTYSNGFREFFIEAINPDRGTPNTSQHSFKPYLVAEKFALPQAQYVVDEPGSFTVEWQ